MLAEALGIKSFFLIKRSSSSLTLRTPPLSWKGPQDKLNLASKNLSHSHLINVFIYYVTCTNVLPACMCRCTTCMLCALGCQKRASDPLGLSMLGIKSGSSGRATCVLNCWTNSSAPDGPSRWRQLGVIFRTCIWCRIFQSSPHAW